MIVASLATVLFWIYCGGMSVLARESQRPILQNTLFQLFSVVLYFTLATWLAGSFIRLGNPFMTVPGLTLVLIFGVLLGFRYLSFLISEVIDRIHAGATGIGTMKVQKSYDLAEKAEREGDLDRALTLYSEEATRDPTDPEPLRRMGEIRLRRGDTGTAIEIFRRAIPLVELAEPKSTLAFRLADLLEREGRGGEARGVLESIERDLAGTKFATFAKDRLQSLT